MVIATGRGTSRLKTDLRDGMRGAGLGRLGQALGSVSDADRGGTGKRYPDGSISAGGVIFVRSRSARTVGALTSYLGDGSTEITPRRGRWLWFPSDEIRRIGGSGAAKRRLTPGNWSKFGMDRKIGPLVRVTARGGRPLLIVKEVGVSAAGRRRSARSLTKSGRPRKGDVSAGIIAFIGIPRTSRQARVDHRRLHREVMAELPAMMRQALGRH